MWALADSQQNDVTAGGGQNDKNSDNLFFLNLSCKTKPLPVTLKTDLYRIFAQKTSTYQTLNDKEETLVLYCGDTLGIRRGVYTVS